MDWAVLGRKGKAAGRTTRGRTPIRIDELHAKYTAYHRLPGWIERTGDRESWIRERDRFVMWVYSTYTSIKERESDLNTFLACSSI